MAEEFKKCKICGIPLNREIVSEKDPNLCFECAEEHRKYTPQTEAGPDYTSENIAQQFKSKKKKSFLDKLKSWRKSK